MVQPELTPVEIVGYEVDEAGSPLFRQWVVHNDGMNCKNSIL